MIRWGILSTAKIGITQAIPALIEADNCAFVAIASRSTARAQEVAAQFNISHVFGSYDALLASDEVDAVYIPLPTSHHVEWSRKAAEAGKHVLCEKPIALAASEIDGLIDARDSNGVELSEAMMAVYHPQWHKVRALIQDGAIGQLRHFTSSFAYHNTDPENIRNKIDTGGGALPDIGCYPVATTRFVTGANAYRAVAQVHRDRSFGTDISAACLVDFGSFDLLMHVATQIAWRQTASFHGETGFIQLAAPFNSVPGTPDTLHLFRDGQQNAEIFRFEGVNQYRLQFEAFARAIAEDEDGQLLSLENSRINQSIIDAVYSSSENGQWREIV